MKTVAVFVDLTKAFDKVWNKGLLRKLLKKNVCSKMYGWIYSYLFQRTARVKLEGQMSSLVKLREGVPQGGVISPTLFTIFIDHITDQLTLHISRALHADDLAAWTKAEQVNTATHRMLEAVNNITNWVDKWMVSINRTKTEATCFSLAPKKEAFTPQTKGQAIPQQENPTYLGVKLDKRLTWSPHINTMHRKAVSRHGNSTPIRVNTPLQGSLYAL